jgi:hypothetical protein
VTAHFNRFLRDAGIHDVSRRPRVSSLLGMLCLVGGLATFAGGQAVKAASLSATTITSSAVPNSASIGADLTDSATLANTASFDGSGSIQQPLSRLRVGGRLASLVRSLAEGP